MKLVLWMVLVAAGVGCGTKANPASCLDGHCSDLDRPFCDTDGAIGGEPNTCIAIECMAGAFGACRGDRALMCNATGDNYDVVDCQYGCSDAAGGCNACNTSDCEKHIIPKYLPTICNQVKGGDPLVISVDSILNTSDSNECHQVVAQANAPEICVYRWASITLERNKKFDVYGERVPAIVADRDIWIDGVLDVGAKMGANGPGGGFIQNAGNATGREGGGGQGFKTNGANGASLSTDGGLSNGGSAQQNPAQLTTLVGGAGYASPLGIASAAAGGGVTLISCRGTVRVTGIIDANGGGGSGGGSNMLDIPPTPYPASGGGSGGHVVLQGMNVVVTGELYANGGGGGAGQTAGGFSGQAGQRGARAATAAFGGVGQNGEGSGGNGGFAGAPPTVGRRPTGSSFEGAGAGGGSVGFLQIYTPEAVTPTVTPSGVSPAFEPIRTLATN